MIDCPSCGEEIDKGSQFCRFCGKEVSGVPEDFDLKDSLQSMDEYQFEHFVGDLWEKMGWEAEVSKASNDKGIDIRAKRDHPYQQKALIQAKRYSSTNSVGSPDIQQYASLKHQEDNVDSVVIVTTGRFSRGAEELGSDLNVKLIDGDDLVALVDELDADDLVDEYFGVSMDAVDESDDEGDVVSEVESNSELEDLTPSLDGDSDESTTNDDSLAEKSENDTREEEENHAQSSGEIDLPGTIWQKGVAVTTVAWVAVFALVDTVPDSVFAILLFGSWIGMPLCIYMDSKATREVVHWPKYRKTYLLVSTIWLINILLGVWYLLLRYTVTTGNLEIDSPDQGNPDSKDTQSKKKEAVEKADIDISMSMHGPGFAKGKDYEFEHHSDALSKIQELKQKGRESDLERLLQWCISETESESHRTEAGVVPHYYEELAKLYRENGMYEKEVEILERFSEQEHNEGKKPQELIERLGRARTLANR